MENNDLITLEQAKEFEQNIVQKHFDEISKLELRELFAKDDSRFEKFSTYSENLFLDYSKNNITEENINLSKVFFILFNLSYFSYSVIQIMGFTKANHPVLLCIKLISHT